MVFILVLLFISIEQFFSLRPKQPIFRKAWKTDIYHFFFSHLLIHFSSFLIISPSLTLSKYLQGPRWVVHPSFWLQFLEIVCVADFTQYWVHRLFHEVPFLWKFHSIHHSSEELDWLANSRLHLGDVVITRTFTLVPLFLLQFEAEVLKAYLIFVAFWATFLHANCSFRLIWLDSLVATPFYHHWHHAKIRGAENKNYSVHLPIFDILFGTYYFPQPGILLSWPEKYGLQGKRFPQTFLKQVIYPFKQFVYGSVFVIEGGIF